MTDNQIWERSYFVQACRRFDSALATAFSYSILSELLRRVVNPVDETIAHVADYLNQLLAGSVVHAAFFGVPTGTVELSFAVSDHFAERIEGLRAEFSRSRIVQLFTDDRE